MWEAKDDYDKAMLDFTEAIRLDPRSDDAYYRRGVVLFEQGEYDRAIADFGRVIQALPG
jgi:tetratricopeptide (TPR) repeat protein